jgi:simple sugar transport system permease protein
MHKKAKQEPFVRIVKRTETGKLRGMVVRLSALVLALFVSALFLHFVTGLNPLKVYEAMLEGAFGGASAAASLRRSFKTISDAMVLLCISVALAPAFKMRFWNIGAEGQVLMGGVVTAGMMLYFGDLLPAGILLPLILVVSGAAGAAWGLLPALFKGKWNTNETLFTLMMNYVAIQLTSYCVAKWENPYGSNSVGIINANTRAGWLPSLLGLQYGTQLLIAFLVLLITVLMFFYMRKTKQGYEISVVGESVATAKYAGISVRRVMRRTMLISGAICGLAGALVVSGIDHTISVNTAGGRGFTAIIVAWMAKFNTFTMILIAFLLTFLDRGAVEIASQFHLNEFASDIITGIILFFILGSEFFCSYRMVFRKGAK